MYGCSYCPISKKDDLKELGVAGEVFAVESGIVVILYCGIAMKALRELINLVQSFNSSFFVFWHCDFTNHTIELRR